MNFHGSDIRVAFGTIQRVGAKATSGINGNAILKKIAISRLMAKINAKAVDLNLDSSRTKCASFESLKTLHLAIDK